MEKLDQYFDKAKKENEIVPLSDIDNIILSKNNAVQQKYNTQFFYNLFHRREYVYLASFAFTILLISVIATLVIEPKNPNNELFIPEGQRRIVHLVKNISAYPQNSKISLSQFGSSSNLEASKIPIHLRTKFELSEEQLKLLGITFSDQFTKYEGNVTNHGYVSFSVETTKSVSVTVDNKRPGVKEYPFYPWFLSNEEGRQNVRYRFNNEDSLKMTNAFFLSVIDQLIPIQVARPGFKKVIFWYSQTPELMNILESAAMVSNNSKRTDDSDRKRNTIDIQIFPTITTGVVQIVARVHKEQNLEISVLNSSGEIILVPIDNQDLKEGEHNFSMDLSNFGNGLYFIRIKSNPGFITIHRLFKE
jgi:hypothetical protein